MKAGGAGRIYRLVREQRDLRSAAQPALAAGHAAAGAAASFIQVPTQILLENMSTPSASAGATRIPIIDKALSSGKTEVSASAFAFLFSELVQYSLHRVKAVEDLEKRYPLLPPSPPPSPANSTFHPFCRTTFFFCASARLAANLFLNILITFLSSCFLSFADSRTLAMALVCAFSSCSSTATRRIAKRQI